MHVKNPNQTNQGESKDTNFSIIIIITSYQSVVNLFNERGFVIKINKDLKYKNPPNSEGFTLLSIEYTQYESFMLSLIFYDYFSLDTFIINERA